MLFQHWKTDLHMGGPVFYKHKKKFIPIRSTSNFWIVDHKFDLIRVFCSEQSYQLQKFMPLTKSWHNILNVSLTDFEEEKDPYSAFAHAVCELGNVNASEDFRPNALDLLARLQSMHAAHIWKYTTCAEDVRADLMANQHNVLYPSKQGEEMKFKPDSPWEHFAPLSLMRVRTFIYTALNSSDGLTPSKAEKYIANIMLMTSEDQLLKFCRAWRKPQSKKRKKTYVDCDASHIKKTKLQG